MTSKDGHNSQAFKDHLQHSENYLFWVYEVNKLEIGWKVDPRMD